MKSIFFLPLLLLTFSCALMGRGGGQNASKAEIRSDSKKPTWDPDTPVSISQFLSGDETFTCHNLGLVSDDSISASRARNNLLDKAEQLGGNRVLVREATSGSASGFAMRCHTMTGVPLDIIKARCEIKDNPLACEYYFEYLYSNNFVSESSEWSCSRCKSGMEHMCSLCGRATDQLKVEKIKNRLISECEKKNSKSCHKCAVGFYGEGNKDLSLRFAQLGCLHGSKEACRFQTSLMAEKNADAANAAMKAQQEAIRNQQAIQYMQYQQQNNAQLFRNLANSLDVFKSSSPTAPAPQATNCEYKFHKDMSPTGGTWVQHCR